MRRDRDLAAKLVGTGLLVLFVLVAFVVTRPITTTSIKLDLGTATGPARTAPR